MVLQNWHTAKWSIRWVAPRYTGRSVAVPTQQPRRRDTACHTDRECAVQSLLSILPNSQTGTAGRFATHRIGTLKSKTQAPDHKEVFHKERCSHFTALSHSPAAPLTVQTSSTWTREITTADAAADPFPSAAFPKHGGSAPPCRKLLLHPRRIFTYPGTAPAAAFGHIKARPISECSIDE